MGHSEGNNTDGEPPREFQQGGMGNNTDFSHQDIVDVFLGTTVCSKW